MLNLYANHLLAAGRSHGTVAQRVGHITALCLIIPDVLHATPEQLEKVLADRRSTHSAEARKSLRASMRSFYSWAAKKKLIEIDPSIDLPAVTVPRLIPRLAPDDDVQVALITATDVETAMILLGRLAGLRLNEITTLHTRQREGNLLRITGKGEKQRMVPINPDLAPVLTTLEREQGSGYYFRGRFGGHMHPASVNKIITRVTGWNPHSLRHAAATAAYRTTGDLRGVQEFLGHASLATTERYLHVGLEEVTAAAYGTSFKQPVRSPHFPSTIAA